MPSRAPIQILSWGGIGDTLRNIGLVPHEYLFSTLGIRCGVIRRPHLPHEVACPPTRFFEELVRRSPTLEWLGEAAEPPRSRRLLNRLTREISKALNGGTPRYFPFNFQLTPEEAAGLPKRRARKLIGVQTHLAGIGVKHWGTANWARFIERVLASDPEVDLLLIDDQKEVAQLGPGERVLTTCGLNIAQSLEAIKGVDLLVSIDSWTKYVAASEEIPQVVVVPSQAQYHPPEYLAQNSFEGIFGRPQNLLIGLAGTRAKPRVTLPQMSDLQPDLLVEATLRHLQAWPRSPQSSTRRVGQG